MQENQPLYLTDKVRDALILITEHSLLFALLESDLAISDRIQPRFLFRVLIQQLLIRRFLLTFAFYVFFAFLLSIGTPHLHALEVLLMAPSTSLLQALLILK